MKPLDYAMPEHAGLLTGADAPAGLDELSFRRKQRWLQQHGVQSSAYFNLQDGVRHFVLEGAGFLSYFPQRTPLGRVNILYANPVCEPARLPELLDRYFEEIPGRSFFIGVDHQVAMHLKTRGFRPNHMGNEFAIPLDRFDLAGKHKKQLRHAANLGERFGLKVIEQTWSETQASQVRAISEAWRGQKAVSGRELRLLTRPPVFGDEWEVRKFYCYQGDQLLGYVFFDPFFSEGRVIGYCANILRSRPGVKPSGLLDYVLLEAIRQFQQEGIAWLSLGIAPLHGVTPMSGDRPSVRKMQQWMYEHGNSLYAFKALAYHKSRYRGVETPWYLCSDDISLPKLTWALMVGTGLLGLR